MIKYHIVNEQRVVVFSAREALALNDTVIAVPFALLKFLAGSLVTAEGQAELARMGGQIHMDPPLGTPQ